MRTSGLTLGVIVVVLLFTAAPVKADSATLTLSSVSGTPGSTVTVDGTITNTGSDTVYLNSESFTLAFPPFINGDITDFFMNAPISLGPGENSGLIAIFTFEIEPGTTPGTYSGNFLDIIGGASSSDFTDTLTSAGFSVDVLGGTAPEPGAFLLLSTGLLGLLPLRRKCRTTSSSN